jgi:hypothetical protein
MNNFDEIVQAPNFWELEITNFDANGRKVMVIFTFFSLQLNNIVYFFKTLALY